MNDVVLFSGGLDSYITWHKVGKPDTLYVDFGHKYARHEKAIVLELIPSTKIFSVPEFHQFEKDTAEIPLRNLYLAMIAVSLGYDKIWLTVQKDELSIPDRTPCFFLQAQQLLSKLSSRRICMDTPWWEVDKTGMVEWYLQQGLPIPPLLRTWACYYPTVHGKPCGNCGACFRRMVALSLNGIQEEWHTECQNSETAKMYLQKAERGEYSNDRCKRIQAALGNIPADRAV